MAAELRSADEVALRQAAKVAAKEAEKELAKEGAEVLAKRWGKILARKLVAGALLKKIPYVTFVFIVIDAQENGYAYATVNDVTPVPIADIITTAARIPLDLMEGEQERQRQMMEDQGADVQDWNNFRS